MGGFSYWYAWDRQRKMPTKTQAEFEEYVQRRKREIHSRNQDWFEGVIGLEGYGKSQYALGKCQVWDSTFIDNIDDRIIYNVNKLEESFHREEIGISLLIDEAVYLAHSRSGFRTETVRFVEDIIGCRYLKNYIALAFQS